MNTLMTWAISPPRLPILQVGRGFRDLQGYITETAILVFDAVAALTIAIEHYLEGQPVGLSLGALSKMRTAVQYRLLSLPSCTELEKVPLVEPHLYEACRLTALIYGVAVVYPIPNSYKALQKLVQLLQDSLKAFSVEQLGAASLDMLLWVLVIGAIAAFEKPERPWYIAQLAKRSKEWTSYDWEKVEEKMTLFLWLESACGSGGRIVWTEVTERLRTPETQD